MAKTLEQEFAEYKGHHIYEIIVTGLIKLEPKGIYTHKLLSDYKRCPIKDVEQRAYFVAGHLYDKYTKKGDNKYLDVYEMIWEEIRDNLNDNMSIRIGVNYD